MSRYFYIHFQIGYSIFRLAFMRIHIFTNTTERLESEERLVSSIKCCNEHCTLEILPVFAYYVSYLCPMHLYII